MLITDLVVDAYHNLEDAYHKFGGGCLSQFWMLGNTNNTFSEEVLSLGSMLPLVKRYFH